MREACSVAYCCSVSEQLCSSKYRFLYEIIQNADNSTYCNANAAGTPRFVHFRITAGTITIETNEDGFTRADVEAICATDERSKKGSTSDEHIGEKGFGFKSVFSVAKEVHIQSGVWSFQFKYHPNDAANSGLGMVTPLEALREPLPSGVKTRITLRLTAEAQENYEKLLDAVNEIPSTTIFFLQRLNEIKMSVQKTDGQTEIITFTKEALPCSRKSDKLSTTFDLSTIPYTSAGFLGYANSNTARRIAITRSREVAGDLERDVDSYFCFTHTKTDMPQNSLRKDKSSARIDLAFPVIPSTSAPKFSEHGQHVFAYLPLQRLPQIQVSTSTAILRLIIE